MPLYFAYGANMDRAGMAERCPASRSLGLARLKRHRFIIMAEGYASVVRDERGEVHGVLWQLALRDVAALDRFEEIERGLYRKALQSVLTAEGPRRALVYLGRSATPGRPRPGYMPGVIASAEGWKLPAPYLAELRRWDG